MHRTKSTRLAIAVAATLPVVGLLSSQAKAVDLYWDGDGVSPQAGGAGLWDTANARFSQTSGGTVDQIWNNGNFDSAIFDGTASTAVTLAGPITVNIIHASVGG